MAFALQWSLDNTTSSGLSLSRGLIAAATSDNVEPLAVVACEKFGATLSICRDSCAKTERLVEPQKPVIRFLGAYIGYSANDCATQLVKSVAGVQFLALAGPLVSSIELMTGANALEVLLERSAGDKTQSQDSTNSKTFWKNATRVPDAHAIAELVLGLSKLKVLGPSSRLEIKAGHEIPWVVAFTRWFLGTCPSITFECGEILLRSSSEFRVTIIALEGHNMPLEITFPTDLGRPSDLIDGNVSDNRWSGMVSVKAYGQFLRDEFDMSSEDDIRRLEIFLPYALTSVNIRVNISRPTTPILHFMEAYQPL
ncbi:hypothetical protein IFR04_014292 [Cadophora malorum]|uniref:Uncharacterized protein n=1 Tax=Cadophora malorum TaxID=108018 RepID=A0A8H7VZM5_9HELO|nr:hypothetical protein IFR04_014292 [Cadophora malorum]